jgi:hypothetical protein
MKARKIAERKKSRKEELGIRKFATANPSVSGEEGEVRRKARLSEF